MPEAFGQWWCWAEQVGNDSGGTDTLGRSCGDTEGGTSPSTWSQDAGGQESSGALEKGALG